MSILRVKTNLCVILDLFYKQFLFSVILVNGHIATGLHADSSTSGN